MSAIGIAASQKNITLSPDRFIDAEVDLGTVGLLALLRNEGGSVGASVAQIIEERREQFHTLRLNEHLDPLSPPVRDFIQRGADFFQRNTGDPALSEQLSLAALAKLRS